VTLSAFDGGRKSGKGRDDPKRGSNTRGMPEAGTVASFGLEAASKVRNLIPEEGEMAP